MNKPTTAPANIRIEISTVAGTHLVFIDAATAFDAAKSGAFMGVSEPAGTDAAKAGHASASIDTTKAVAVIMASGIASRPYKVKTFGGVASGNRYRKYATLAEATAALKAWAKRRFRVLPTVAPAAPAAPATTSPRQVVANEIAAASLALMQAEQAGELLAIELAENRVYRAGIAKVITHVQYNGQRCAVLAIAGNVLTVDLNGQLAEVPAAGLDVAGFEFKAYEQQPYEPAAPTVSAMAAALVENGFFVGGLTDKTVTHYYNALLTEAQQPEPVTLTVGLSASYYNSTPNSVSTIAKLAPGEQIQQFFGFVGVTSPGVREGVTSAQLLAAGYSKSPNANSCHKGTEFFSFGPTQPQEGLTVMLAGGIVKLWKRATSSQPASKAAEFYTLARFLEYVGATGQPRTQA